MQQTTDLLRQAIRLLVGNQGSNCWPVVVLHRRGEDRHEEYHLSHYSRHGCCGIGRVAASSKIAQVQVGAHRAFSLPPGGDMMGIFKQRFDQATVNSNLHIEETADGWLVASMVCIEVPWEATIKETAEILVDKADRFVNQIRDELNRISGRVYY